MEAKDCKCCVCGKQAVAFYPCIDPDIPSYPYCADCLEKAMIETAKAFWPDDKGMLLIAREQANEAPEKLYLHPTAKGEVGASWLTFPLTDNDIEYTRTDSFIEKAALWLEDNMRKWFKNMNTHGLRMTGLMVDEFKKAMKL